jgi:hypothetical protein
MPGPSPKDPSTRARRNVDPIPTTVLTFVPGVQPELPPRYEFVDVDGVRVRRDVDWPARTVEWWAMWGDSAIAERFAAADWEFLLDTAMVHAAFWDGDLKQGAELRQRVAKFGATPEDRAKLRIQYAAADEADERVGRVRKVAPQPTSSNDPRRHLTALN